MVTVRRATPADAAEIAAYQVAMAQETQGLALEPDVVAIGVRAVFDDAAKGEYWVADVDGVVLGRSFSPCAGAECHAEVQRPRKGRVRGAGPRAGGAVVPAGRR